MRRLHIVSLLVVALLLGLAPAALAAVRITKIAFNPPGNDLPSSNQKLNREYVVLYNDGNAAKRLGRWVLMDKDTDGHRFRFPKFKLRAGAYVRIHTGSGTNDRNHLYWGADNYIMLEEG
jgi:hypothetical protein